MSNISSLFLYKTRKLILSTPYSGYGIVDQNNNLIWSCCNESESTEKCSASLVELVRDRDYPDFKIVFWYQSALGGKTVTKDI